MTPRPTARARRRPSGRDSPPPRPVLLPLAGGPRIRSLRLRPGPRDATKVRACRRSHGTHPVPWREEDAAGTDRLAAVVDVFRPLARGRVPRALLRGRRGGPWLPQGPAGEPGLV